MPNDLFPEFNDEVRKAVSDRFAEIKEICNSPQAKRAQEFTDSLEDAPLLSYYDSEKRVVDEFILETLQDIYETQQQMIEDAERDRQAAEQNYLLAKRESGKNTAVLIFTILGVLVTATGIILTITL